MNEPRHTMGDDTAGVGEACGEAEHAWRVLHVKPKCEKKMHEYLAAIRVENYLPLRVERKVYQRRKVRVELPLFPGYIFGCFGAGQRVSVLKSQFVVRILEVKDQRRLLSELAQVRRALEANPFVSACTALARGERVRITGGPLRGMEGIINVIKGETRVILLVESIGQGVAVETDPAILERI